MLRVFTEKPCSKPIITLRHGTSVILKQTMALYNVTGHWRHQDIIDADLFISRKTVCECLTASVLALIRFNITVLIETNVNISGELNLSEVYQSENYTGSLAKVHEPILGSFTLHATQCSLHFNKSQKNEIHFLIERSEFCSECLLLNHRVNIV